jgi:hypothetical protein
MLLTMTSLWAAGGHSVIVISLTLVCFAILVAIPSAAWRGRLHIPGYAGIAILSFGMAMVFGWLARPGRVPGVISGTVVAVAFFLLMAAGVGSVLALLFYRSPEL